MKQTLLTFVFALAAVVFGGLWISQSDDEVAPAAVDTSAFEESIADLQRKLQALEAQNGELQAELVSLQSARAAAAADVADVGSGGDSELDDLFGDSEVSESSTNSRDAQMGKALNAFIGNLSNMFSAAENGEGNEMTQAWRDNMQIEGRRRVARSYGDLLSQFDLTLEDREKFIGLLAERGGMRGGWGDWGGESAQLRKTEAEEKIREFLGDEGYKTYEDFEDTRYARGRVDDFAKELGSGLAMQPEQREAMIGMFDQMEGFNESFRREAWAGEGTFEEKQVKMNARLDELHASYNKMVADAGEVLDQPQVEALATHLDTNLQRVEKQIEMGQMWRKQMEQNGGGEIFKMFEGLRGGR